MGSSYRESKFHPPGKIEGGKKEGEHVSVISEKKAGYFNFLMNF